MGFRDCMLSAARQGAISQDEADDLIARYEAHRRANRATDHPAGPEGAAKDALLKDVSEEAERKKRVAALAAARTKEITTYLTEFRKADGKPDVVAAAKALLENRNNRLAGTPSVAGRRDALTGWAHGRLEQLLYDQRRTWLTGARRDPVRLDAMVDEAFGIHSGDARAGQFLGAWRQVADDLVDRFNAAGGAIEKLDRYFPQTHDARKLARDGFAAWRDFIAPRLDLDRMRDPLTGGPFDPARTDAALRVVWSRIVTDGAVDLKPSGQPFGRGALANQRQEHRFLTFKDAQAWRDYAAAYGRGGPYEAMMGHIHGLAKDVAALEILGPNPAATIEWLRQVAQSEAAKAETGAPSLSGGISGRTASGRLAGGADGIGNLWNVVNGSVGTGNMVAADLLEAGRNWLMAANLGGTALTAVLGDPFQQANARRFAGVPALRAIAEIPRQVFSGASKRDITRAGIIMTDALEHLQRDFRLGSVTAASKELSRWLPDRVFTWSGLTPWTNANRRAQAYGIMFEAGDRAGQALDEIAADGVAGQRFARWLEGFGIDGEMWDRIRAASGLDHGEAGRMLRPIDVMRHAEGDPALFEAGLRWSEAVHAFQEEAVPQGTAAARTALGAANPKGTVTGEVVRNTFSYLSYPTSLLMSLMRAVSLEAADGGWARGAGYLGSSVIGLTIGGALILEMKALRRGQDPENVGNPKFWARALVQGGALGYWGDWLLADYERGPADFMGRFAGPIGGFAGKVAAAVDVQGFASDKAVPRGKRALELAKSGLPVQNMWWLRPVTERAVWDQLQLLTDPNAYRSWARREQELAKEGRGVWWAPGELLPRRGAHPVGW